MGAFGTVTNVGYLTIRTRDLSASIKEAEETLGLRLVENSGTKAFLAAADTHHEVVYLQDETDSIDHFAVSVDNLEELAAIRAKVDERQYPIVSAGPIEDYVEHGFAFVGPEGFTWQPYVALPWRDTSLTGGYGPQRYGHINYRVLDTVAQVKFLVEVFGLRVSDMVGDGELYFLRCSPEHHGIAVGRSHLVGLHHHAWATQSIADLGRLGDRLARQGRRLVHGPLRHGAGNNIAAYFQEPSGGIVEVYCDMELIFDRDRPMRTWDIEDLYWVNQWDGLMNAAILDFNTPVFEREIARV
ncbi:VOC family protein [Microbacterium ulmi]|uniref:VOC domain-containing protein n=1 Tax=Microbacterium ulmi TaxID=179095 RepID=A0A7Y2LZY7_9MICO|nr:VOC family protein [Microbacterium ulmi]NII68978.1 catechol-2,3-dioxygenase [Microbacterium ulmi]NNH03961.1 hypothetical protein [Microbacterium ulmi]